MPCVETCELLQQIYFFRHPICTLCRNVAENLNTSALFPCCFVPATMNVRPLCSTQFLYGWMDFLRLFKCIGGIIETNMTNKWGRVRNEEFLLFFIFQILILYLFPYYFRTCCWWWCSVLFEVWGKKCFVLLWAGMLPKLRGARLMPVVGQYFVQVLDLPRFALVL